MSDHLQRGDTLEDVWKGKCYRCRGDLSGSNAELKLVATGDARMQTGQPLCAVCAWLVWDALIAATGLLGAEPDDDLVITITGVAHRLTDAAIDEAMEKGQHLRASAERAMGLRTDPEPPCECPGHSLYFENGVVVCQRCGKHHP